MTISLTGATVDTGVPAQIARPHAPAVISAAGINDQAAIARQQLAIAVPAPALLAAYSANIREPVKPAAKLLASTPSSSLAAQFIGQDAIAEEDLAIFEAPKQPVQQQAAEEAGDDYLKDLRIARGDLSDAKKTTVSTQAEAVKQQAAANDNALRNGLAQFAAALPAVLSQFMKRPTLVQAKGVVAYQLAEARNAASRASLAKKELAEAN